VSSLRRILRDVAIVSSGQVVTWLATFLFVLAQARSLGPASFGELSLALSYATFFAVVVDFGVSTYLTRAVAQRENAERAVLWTAVTTRAALWLIAMPLAWLATMVLGYEAELQATTLILVGSLLFVGSSGALTAFYQGKERFLLPTLANIVQRVAAAIVGILVLQAGLGVISVAVVYAISAAFALILLAAGLRGTGLLRIRVEPRANWRLVRSVLPIAIYWVAGTLYFNVDMVLIERLMPREALGNYAAAYRLFSAAAILPAIVCGTVLYPMYARLSGASSAALRPVVQKTIAYLALAGILVAVVFVSLASPIVGLLYPLPAYAPAASALRLLAPGLFFLYVNSVLGSALFALRLERRLVLIATTAAVLNTIANLALIPVFGIEAAAAITSLTEIFLFGCLLVASPRGLVGSASRRFATRAALVGGVTALALLPLTPAPIAISAPLGALVFGGACLLFRALPADDLRLATALLRGRIAARRLG